MTLPFAMGESSTGYPFPCQERVYSYSSEEGSCVDPGILSEASDAAVMASAFRARNDLYSCGSMHHKAARCYFRAAEGLQSDPVTRAGIMLLCHSHAMRAKVRKGKYFIACLSIYIYILSSFCVCGHLTMRGGRSRYIFPTRRNSRV